MGNLAHMLLIHFGYTSLRETQDVAYHATMSCTTIRSV